MVLPHLASLLFHGGKAEDAHLPWLFRSKAGDANEAEVTWSRHSATNQQLMVQQEVTEATVKSVGCLNLQIKALCKSLSASIDEYQKNVLRVFSPSERECMTSEIVGCRIF